MATHKLAPIPFPKQSPKTITSEQIRKYAEISSLVAELEAEKQALRSELLSLRAAGAEQETFSPYLLQFAEQERRTVDWKGHALALAEKLYGAAQLENWKVTVEASAPVTAVTQVKVKPNPAFAAGLAQSVGVQ